MTVSEYIVKYLKEIGIKHFFGYQGTMIAYFVDAIGNEEGINNHVCYNEQGAALAACGLAKSMGKMTVAYSTSGPGAINLMQGIADAYYDSVPVLFITGQLNLSEYTSNMALRQQGFQETDIISMVKPITKMAIQIKNPEEIQNILPQAVEMTMEGRRGPVLIDIPMDIQKYNLFDKGEGVHWEKKTKDRINSNMVDDVVKTITDALIISKKPIFIFGSGVSSREEVRRSIKELIIKYKIPSVTTMLAMDLLEVDNEYNYGYIGYAYGKRYSNFITNVKADLIVSFGARLCSRQIGLDKEEFAKKAKIIRIDIDPNELKQKIHKEEISFCVDACDIIKGLLNVDLKKEFVTWCNTCSMIKKQLEDVDLNKEYRKPNEIIEYLSSLIPG